MLGSKLLPADSSTGTTDRHPNLSATRRIWSNNALERKLSRYDGHYTALASVQEEEALAGSWKSSPSPTAVSDVEDVARTTPQRRKSTKDLITRYESLNSPTASTVSPHISLTPATRPVCLPSALFLPPQYSDKPVPALPSEHEHDQGDPLCRRTFKSFFGAFSKKSRSPQAKTPRREPSSLHLSRATPSSSKPSLTSSAYPCNGLTSWSAILNSGSVLHLHKPQATSSHHLLPVWTSCVLTLHVAHLALSSVSARGNPKMMSLPLAECTNVRTLARDDLDPEDWAMLPSSVGDDPKDNGGEPKVFAVFFEGKPRGTFAVKSVEERARWISAIWDAAFLCNTEKPSPYSERMRLHVPLLLPQPLEPLVSAQPSKTLPQAQSIVPVTPTRQTPTVPEALGVFTDRPLPPMPPRDYYVQSPMRSRPASPPTTPLYASPREEPRHSMRDLAERSVVKQRLAQLQPQTKILGSSVRSVHTPASTAVQPPSSAIPEDLETDSIVDSYCYSPLPFTPFGQHSALSLGSPVTSASASPLPSPLTESSPGRPSTNDKLVRPVMDMLEAHALNQHNQMADLDAQLGGLKAEVQRLADEVTNALARPAGKSKYGGIAIPNAAAEKDEIPQDVEKTVRELEAKEDTQAMCIRRADGNDQCQGLQMLRVLAEENRHDQVILTERMNCLSEQVAGLDVTLRTALEGFSNKMEGVHIEIRRSPANWQEVPTKLDELAELQPRRMMDNSPPAASHSTSGMQEQLRELAHLVKDDRESQKAQQADSARYLGELNAWLETFVHSAASHNAEVAATVQQLGATLRASEPQGQNVLLELKQLFLAHQETNALLQKAAQDSATPHTETNQCESIQSIVAILERERQAQKCAFKSFAAEMAAQIKGERLRFVDAMKEATAIHVQMHVEQFRREVAHEVAGMSQEISRLQHERGGIARQLAHSRARQQQTQPIVAQTTPQPLFRSTSVPSGPRGLGMTPSMSLHYQSLSVAQH